MRAMVANATTRKWRPAKPVLFILSLVVVLSGCTAPSEGPDENPQFGYPDQWRVSLQEAIEKATFKIKLPHHQFASRENIQEVFLYPDRTAVVLTFPLPKTPSAPIRKDRLEIYQSPWEGGDPLLDYQRDIAEDPVTGKRIHYVNGVPALGVEAHAPEDETGENPAFLRFVTDGVEVQLSGGESVEDLISIAETMRDAVSLPGL